MSNDLSRRHFLTGSIAATTATALTLALPDKAVQLFEPTMGEILAVTRMPAHEPPAVPVYMNYGEFVFNSQGQPIGIIRSIVVERQAIDVTADRDSYRRYAMGSLSVEYIVQGTGSAYVKA